MLTKSKIEYLDFGWSFYTGCRHTTEKCPCAADCWAHSMAKRFGKSFEPTLHPEKLLDPLKLRKPSRIGVCFTGDLFGEWVDPDISLSLSKYAFNTNAVANSTLKDVVKIVIKDCPQHQFFFLTKNPAGLRVWGKFPENSWVGATACNDVMLTKAVVALSYAETKNRWLSIEPLMDWKMQASDLVWTLNHYQIKWLVIGGWSGGKNPPKIDWVKQIVDACDQAGIKVWLKNNLNPLFAEINANYLKKYKHQYFRVVKKESIEKDGKLIVTTHFHLRQELPEATK